MQFMNNLRGWAILAIVYAHAISCLPEESGLISWIEFLIGNGTILFVAIAGYLFSATGDGFRYVPYIKNKFMTVILPYLILSLPAILLHFTSLKETHVWVDMDWFRAQNVLVRVLFMYATGAHLGPLWFIPMIILFYLTSPLWLLIRNAGVKVQLPLLIVTAAIGWYVGRPSHNTNCLQSFLYYIPTYILGITLHRHQEMFKGIGKYSTAALIGYFAVLSAVYFSIGIDSSINSNDTLLLMLPLVVFLMAFFWDRMNHKNKWLSLLARLSFFIFFVHGYATGFYRRLLREAGQQLVAIPLPIYDVLATVFIMATAVMLCLIAFVIGKAVLRDKSRYILGA